MCLGIPGELLEVREDQDLRMGKVRFAGISRDVCLEYVPDPIPGDYALVHVGFANSKIDRAEAGTYRISQEIGQTSDLTADREDESE